MATCISLALPAGPDSIDAMQRSLDAVTLSLAAKGGETCLAGLQQLARSVIEAGYLFNIEFPDGATARTGVFLFQPVDWYLQWVAALARETGDTIAFDHGWPILSVGSRSPTVTEDQGAGNCSPDEQEAA
jgi:hypothetical protein